MPEEPRGYLLLARVHLTLSDPVAAGGAVEQARENGADNNGLARTEAKIAFALDDIKATCDHLQTLAENGDLPLPRWTFAVANRLLGLGDGEGAAAIRANLPETDADKDNLAMLDIRISALTGSFDTALGAMKSLLSTKLKTAQSGNDPDLQAAIKLAGQLMKFARQDAELLGLILQTIKRWPDFKLPQHVAILLDPADNEGGVISPKTALEQVEKFNKILWIAAEGDFNHALESIDNGEYEGACESVALSFATAIRNGRFQRQPPREILADDSRKDVLISAKSQGNVAVLVFCNLTHKPPMPISLLDRVFAANGLTSIFLRDEHKILFGRGVASLGDDLDSSLAALREILIGQGIRETICLGSSGGGFPAIQYGLRLGSTRILNLAGPTNVTPEFIHRIDDRRARILQNRLVSELPRDYLNTRPLLKKAGSKTVLHQFFGDCDSLRIDREYCLYLGGLPNVRNHMLPDHTDHRTIYRLLENEAFESVLTGGED
ncbi:MAG: hypothetical protein GXP03_08840 [Alphaproteobacteria bacterium]|nr:hypothetical protein [Alphaproteobacteria bacterium]